MRFARRLTLRSFDFRADPPTVAISAACAKSRRQDTHSLHEAVVQRLRAWLEAQGDVNQDTRLFPLRTAGGKPRRTSKMMRLDLKRAGLPYADEDGLYADFHALRHTFISNLGKAGVPLGAAQELARHADPKLTASTYTHVGVFDKAAAIDMLPDCPGYRKDPDLGQQRLLATGTDDARSVRTYDESAGQHPGQQFAGEMRQSVAKRGESCHDQDVGGDDTQVLSNTSTPAAARLSWRSSSKRRPSAVGRTCKAGHRLGAATTGHTESRNLSQTRPVAGPMPLASLLG